MHGADFLQRPALPRIDAMPAMPAGNGRDDMDIAQTDKGKEWAGA